MAIELKIPSAGESITEVTIAEWVKEVGSYAEPDETIAVIETDKANVDLPAPVGGKITKILKSAGDVANVGEVIGYMESGDGDEGDDASAKSDDGAAKKSGGGKKKSAKRGAKSEARAKSDDGKGAESKAKGSDDSNDAASKAKGSDDSKKAEPKAKSSGESKDSGGSKPADEKSASEGSAPKGAEGERSHAGEAGGREEIAASPAVRRAMRERGIDAAELKPNGGRVTMDDLLARERPQAPPSPGSRKTERVKMTRMRSRIAERLVGAQQEAALLTTFNEIDMSGVMTLRKTYQDKFVARHGIKLGFMSFFVKAAIEALKAFPAINAYVEDGEIVYHDYYDVGVAVGGGRGLVVPVIRNAERLSFAQVEKTIADFGARARDNKLSIDELQGGTFTISNGGVYGSLMSTPIVNPPQSGILGMHAIQERPIAKNGAIVIAPMMYIALTYDHRLVDGREAVTFLVKIKDLVENPTRLLLEV